MTQSNTQSSLALVAKYLDTSKVNSIALELSECLTQETRDVPSLCDLLDQVDDNTITIINNNAKKYLDHLIDNETDSNQFEDFVKLTIKLPGLYTCFMNKCHEILSGFMSDSLHKFIPEIKSTLDTQHPFNQKEREEEGDKTHYELNYIIYILQFLESVTVMTSGQMTSGQNNLHQSHDLDHLLCYLVTLNIEEIYTISLRIIKSRIGYVIQFSNMTNFFWNIIFALVSNPQKSHQTNGYILWLKYLNHGEDFCQNDFFQSEILQDPDYFNYLQSGLVSELHEHRKLCISILKLSILSINSNITTGIFEWDLSMNDKYMKEWERFLTVFEIMAIDTSLHQAEAASSDIIGLIAPDSLIHPSWGFRLLSTGFRAGTDSIRKFTLNLLLSIPSNNLYLLKFALPILQDIFLPYMMLANHLIVVDDQCLYGETLTSYIKSIITSCQSTNEIQDLVSTIFAVINNSKDAFDPCKIYVLNGVLLGLESIDNLILEFGNHDSYLIPLFEINSEGILYHKVLQTINLRLLLKFKFELSGFLKSVEKFIRFNGANLINNNLAIIKGYFEFNGITEHDFTDNGENPFITAISYYFKGFLNDNKQFPVADDISIFANLIGTQLDLSLFKSCKFIDWTYENLQAILKAPESISADIYEAISKPFDLELKGPLDLHLLWNLILDDILLGQEDVLRTSVFKYKFLNNLLTINGGDSSNKVEIPFTTKSLVEFKKLIFINVKTSTIQSKDFYKVKEDMLGEFYKTIDYLTTKGMVNKIEVGMILPEISANLSNYGSNFHITSFLNSFLNLILVDEQESSSEINTIGEILLEIWDNLTAIRLQLHQKDLHKILIETILNHKILNQAIENEELVDSILTFSKSVIKNSIGRRSLLPIMTKSLSDYQVNHPNKFNQSYWLCQVFVESFTMYQLKSNAFKIEPVIGHLFDESFGTIDDPLYLNIYQVPEIASKINMLAIFNSIKSSEFANSLLNYILDNGKQYNLYKVIKSTDAYEQWIRLRLTTIVLSIINTVTNELITDKLPIFIGLLGTDPSPLVRIYLEWIISLKIIEFPQFQHQIFHDLKNLMATKDVKPTLVCCYQRILMLMINQMPDSSSDEKIKTLETLLSIIIPGATSNKALIRHFSTSLICNIYSQLVADDIKVSSSTWEIMTNIYQSTSQVIDLNEYRNGDAVLWDIKNDLTLVNISGVILMRASDHDIEFITQEQFLCHLTPSQIDCLNIKIGDDMRNYWIPIRKNQAKKTTITVSSTELLNRTPLQTKSGAWSSIMDDDNNTRGANEITRSDLIVVSSLVDKAPNLGGICRLCDVLGAGLLTLNDITIKNNPEFKNVAVTADYWMPMTEVTIENIIPFLREKKQQGYTLIGLEQTDNSVELNNQLQFPKKSLILLGKEREGVPGDLLAELDMCVEIKQVGVIRSMNIQTATAIIVHAYSSQHC